MSEVFDILLRNIDEANASIQHAPYYLFEPFDIDQPRDQEVIDLAMDDGVDLLADRHIKLYGAAPHLFQSGIIYSESRLNLTISANRVGKSYAELIRVVAQATGELPYCMRHDKGVDTGIHRAVTKQNIYRWGRRDVVTGELIDRDVSRLEDWERGDREWNCGTIIGTGKYPDRMIAPDGSKFWIGTTRRAYIEMWLPSLNIQSKEKCIVPPHFIDVKRGNKGYSTINQMIHFPRGIDFSFITYESGSVKFEAAEVFRITLDEEPPNREIFAAAYPRCQTMAVITTPYKGITWLKQVMESESQRNYKKIWHCTAYDSPYIPRQKVDGDRHMYAPHERAARIWGIAVSQNSSRPAFDKMKINLWMQRHTPLFELSRMVPSREWDGIRPNAYSHLPSLLETKVSLQETDAEDNQYAWRIYEEPKEKTPYVLALDLSSGAESASDLKIGNVSGKDFSAGMMFRPPGKLEKWPQPVALIRSSLPVLEFARVAAMGCRAYNNASLAPEGARVAGANSAFITELRDWPYWYMHSSKSWATRRAQQTRGMDMNVATRDALFHLIGDWVEDFLSDEIPNFYDNLLLTELANMIYNKKGRIDHDTGSKSDVTIAFGIGMYVMKNHAEQFRDNSAAYHQSEEQESFLDRIRKNTEESEEWYRFETFR